MNGRSATIAIHALGVLLLAASGFAAWYFGLRPAAIERETASRLSQQIAAAEVRRAGALAEVTAMSDRVGRALRRSRSVAVELLPAAGLNKRMHELTGWAASSGLQVDVVQPGTGTERPLYTVVPIVCSGRGSYPLIAQVSSALIAEFPDLQITSLVIDGAEQNRTDASFRFDLAWFAGRTGVEEVSSPPAP